MGLSITALAQHYLQQERKVGLLIDADQVVACMIAATRQYAAWGTIESLVPARPSSGEQGPLPSVLIEEIDVNTELNASEYGVIRSLFELYVERENATLLEASRIQGADVYGRASSEIIVDIKAYERELPKLAFYQPVITV